MHPYTTITLTEKLSGGQGSSENAAQGWSATPPTRVRSIDKALSSSEDKPTREALNDAQTGLAAILTLSGVVVPAGRGRSAPRGVGPVVEEAALLDYIRAHPGQRARARP